MNRIAKFGIRLVVATLAIATVSACADDPPTQDFRPLAESPFSSLIPECNQPTDTDSQTGQFIVINPEAPQLLASIYGVGSITVTEKFCPDFWVIISEFPAAGLATQHVADLVDTLDSTDTKLAAHESIFEEPNWPSDRNYSVVIDIYGSDQEFGDAEIDLTIRASVGRFTVEGVQWPPSDGNQISGQAFFVTLEALRDMVNEIALGLQAKASELEAQEISEGEEARVKLAVRRLYALINEGRWEEAWLSYTPEFRDNCPYELYFAEHSPFFRGRVTNVEEFESIDILGKTALASFSVAHSVTGGPVEEYEYVLILVEDGGEWYWEESC